LSDLKLDDDSPRRKPQKEIDEESMERKRSLRDGRQSKRSFRKESPEEEKRSKRSSFNGDVCLQSFDSESKDPNEAFEFEKESANEELPYQ